jgi:putative intracellular protease/amidase
MTITTPDPTWPAPIRVAIPLFARFTALDGIGPYEVLQRIPWLTVTFVGHERGVIRSENGFLGIEVDATFDELSDPEVIVFPGGVGTRALMDDDTVLDWVRTAHETTRFTTSVCTGSLVLAAAGLLDGLTATTHWSTRDTLTRYGAEPVPERVVEHLDRRIITAAGVSSGIDMALRLTELLVDATAARAMQLMIEYDPQPPFDSGALEKSDDATMTRLIEYAAHRD